MIRHPQNYWSLLAQDDVDRIHAAALEVLEQKGLCIQSHAILQYLADAGFRIDATHQKVCIRADDIEKHLAAAPQNWTLHGWDSRNNIRFGSDQLYVAAGYGSPFVAEPDGRRRPATLDDFKNFTALAQRCETVDLMSSLMVEPTDVPVRQRGLDIMHCLLSHTEKPLMGPVHSDEAIEDALAMMRIVFGDQGGPHLLALINVNSPLRLDARMAESMLAYLLADQAILLTPGIMMGTTAPVTTAGALVQAWAELLGVAAICQIIRPGTPLVLGTGGFGADLRCGESGFGRPENAIGMVAGAQLVRRVKLPYRCSAMVTGSRRIDCRSGYERMMTAMQAWQSGAHLVLQGMGILDSINSMSYEQFIIDAEIWGYIRRLARPIAVDDDNLATDLIRENDGNYLAHEHTVRHMRKSIHVPALVPAESYESWLESGGRDVVDYAVSRVKENLLQSHPPHLPDDVQRELDMYVETRRREIS